MKRPSALRPALARQTAFALTLLAIEFLDEFAFGAREAAWPLLRDELRLDYFQVGVLLSVPGVVSSLVEPILGVLADTWRRRLLILGGGAVFTLALLLAAISSSFPLLLFSFVLFYPASGAFVSLSQAALMDADPARREQNMARWTFAGSLGVVAGPLALGAAYLLGASWRGLFAAFALLAAGLALLAARFPFPLPESPALDDDPPPVGSAPPGGLEPSPRPAGLLPEMLHGVAQAFNALRRTAVLRWLTLLQFSDFMLDVLLGFLALYMVDIARGTPAQAGIAVGIWTGMGLLGDFLLIPLLERFSGLIYLRLSAALTLLLYPAFLLLPGFWPKAALLGLLGLLNAGWYAILQARLYAALPGQSGTVVAVNNIFGLFAGLAPLLFGWLALRYNLNVVMWILLLGPVALLVGLPRRADAA